MVKLLKIRPRLTITSEKAHDIKTEAYHYVEFARLDGNVLRTCLRAWKMEFSAAEPVLFLLQTVDETNKKN